MSTPWTHWEWAECSGIAPLILILKTRWEFKPHVPAAEPLENTSGTQWIGRWVGPTVGLNGIAERNLLPLPGLEPRTSTVAWSYTDYTHKNKYERIFLGACKFRVPRPFVQLQVLKLLNVGLTVRQGVHSRTEYTNSRLSEVTLLTCFREVPGLNLDQDTDYPE
jgi:hypothetical protein